MNVWTSSFLTSIMLTAFLIITYNTKYPHVEKLVPCLISEKFTAVENNQTVYKFMCKKPDNTLSEMSVNTSTYSKFGLNQVAEFKRSERVKKNPIYELLIELGICISIGLNLILIFKS